MNFSLFFKQPLIFLLVFVTLLVAVDGSVVKFEGVEGDDSLSTAWKNGALLNTTLNQLRPGDELLFPANSTYYLMGGIIATKLRNNIIRLDGTLIFVDNQRAWPRRENGRVLECLFFDDIENVTFTSSTVGVLDGGGRAWWGILKYIEIGENRPRLLTIANSRNLLIENFFFKNSPYWTVWIYNVDTLEIRYCEISNRFDDYDGHDILNLSAFNTDGFDVTGKNIWIHDCVVWNQDDCVAVKDDSENVLVERVSASGLGLTIGSIGESNVRNVTFRNCTMHHTFKGIYLKFRGNGNIQDVLYEDIVMEAPEQWAIWIGPAQQADSSFVCDAHPCSLCWPELPFAECNMPPNASYVNVTLRNISIINPVRSPGIIFGSDNNPMQGVVFDGVIVHNPPSNYHLCENVANGIATGGTSPVPPCFKSGRVWEKGKKQVVKIQWG